MPDTFTSGYNLTKPEVNASRDTWGTKQNANLDIIDTQLGLLAPKASPAFTGSPTLNGLPLITRADVISLLNALVPLGTIAIWRSATPPTGWSLCTGQTVNGLVTPNLVDRFIVGAGSTYSYGSVGGALSHGHTITVNATGLGVQHMPSHQHSVPAANAAVTGATATFNDYFQTSALNLTFGSTFSGTGGTVGFVTNVTVSEGAGNTPKAVSISGNASVPASTTGLIGGDVAHSHTAGAGTADSRPPYYGVYFIMKTSAAV